ncbi:MAG TPA: patatin-like phospholipase family protein [Candidatus Solibacter sp.]|nr:patatin-like phospholipase family protein [Candidatus Solibacter sp.]
MTTALVLSAGGMWGAWEVGAWRALREHIRPDFIVGASAGAWNGLAIAGGVSPDDLAREWMDASMANLWNDRPRRMYEKARQICSRYPLKTAFALTMVEVPSMRMRIVRDREITWEHLAATSSIPGVFPPMKLDGRWYVDGGFRGGLPLWAAEELGATRAIALNVLTGPMFAMLRRITFARGASSALDVVRIEPSERLGSLKDAVAWSAKNVARWIELGQRDALRAMTSGRI